MEEVILKPIQHRGEECIGIYFEKSAFIQNLIQKNAGAKWSRTKMCWHIPNNAESLQSLNAALESKVIVQMAEVQEKSVKKSNIIPSDVLGNATSVQKIKQTYIQAKPFKIIDDNQEALDAFNTHLILKGYSKSTIRTYHNEFLHFLQLIKNKKAKDFTVLRLKDYFQYCHETLHLSENTLHSKINALKFYYEQVLGREKFFWEIPRPKKHLILPKVLGEDELRRLFAAADNLKHKAILFTAYSAGLRVSEVINLRLQDIDRERRQLFVYCSKGKKDRYVALSPLLIDILENYYKLCKIKPLNYLFEGEEAGKPYSVRSAQAIFNNAKVKAGISKTISFHGLRHSFATHMLEKGVDVKYIKEILGHFNIKTTERYLHVTREKLINIESPLDSLYRKR